LQIAIRVAEGRNGLAASGTSLLRAAVIIGEFGTQMPKAVTYERDILEKVPLGSGACSRPVHNVSRTHQIN
jgi:hypothetical protein